MESLKQLVVDDRPGAANAADDGEEENSSRGPHGHPDRNGQSGGAGMSTMMMMMMMRMMMIQVQGDKLI